MNVFSEQKNIERNGENSFKGKYFERIIKQLLNLAFVGYEECPLDLQNSS